MYSAYMYSVCHLSSKYELVFTSHEYPSCLYTIATRTLGNDGAKGNCRVNEIQVDTPLLGFNNILEIILMVQRYRILEDEWNTTTTTGREFQETCGANDSAKAMGYALKINLTLRTLQSLRHQY